jgi:small subunit ribosomal protein S8e
MGINRSSRHKRLPTGGKRKHYRKKRKFEMGRQPAMTKIGERRVHKVRCRGGNIKFRALRLDTGNYSWPSEGVGRKTRILNVVYNAQSNELVRTNTLVKGAIIQVDATPFRLWYEQHYGVSLGRRKKPTTSKEETTSSSEAGKEGATGKDTGKDTGAPAKKSRHLLAKLANRRKDHQIDPQVEEQFTTGRLLACIQSRPGHVGKADGYILEGKELEFYLRRISKKKAK